MRFRDPDIAVAIHRKSVGATRFRHNAPGRAICGYMGDASGLGRHLDDEKAAVLQYNRPLGELDLINKHHHMRFAPLRP